MERTSDDSKWPRLLALSVHEFRTPMTVVAGYVRMLLKDRAGALNPEQRRLLEEAERSCGRLSMLLAEMSDLSNLEAGTATFNRSAVDLTTLVVDTIAALPDAADREVRVSFARGNGEGAQVTGDPVRLKAAFTAILHALRRELVTSDELLVSQRAGDYEGQPATWIAFGDARHIETLSAGAEAAAWAWRSRAACWTRTAAPSGLPPTAPRPERSSSCRRSEHPHGSWRPP